MHVVVLHQAVLDNSTSDELDVLVQRDAVVAALARLGYLATTLHCTLNLDVIRQRLAALRPDVVFNLVESLAGTDRLMPLVPMLLESLAIPFTGNGSQASSLTSDKCASKRLLAANDLPTPGWCVDDELVESDSTYIIKPIHEHASRGIDSSSLIKPTSGLDLQSAIEARDALVGVPHFAERFIEGREFNLSLMEVAPGEVEVLPIAEIDFGGFDVDQPRIVGHAAKWDTESAEYLLTPRRFDFTDDDSELIEELGQLGRACWCVFDLRGYARVDFRVDAKGEPWILEVNTNPCLSPDAGFAAACDRGGYSFDKAVDKIVTAVCRQTTLV